MVYQLCVTSTLNAYDYLIDRTKDENVHEAFWAMCADTIQYEFELGSRCMAAAMDICKLSDNKNMILEPLSCYRIFDEHTWVASPAAHKLNFTKPVRKEEEISKYVQ